MAEPVEAIAENVVAAVTEFAEVVEAIAENVVAIAVAELAEAAEAKVKRAVAEL